VRSYIFQGLKAEVAFQISGITNINIIIKRRKPNKVEFVLSIHFTPIVMDKKAEVSNDFVTQSKFTRIQTPIMAIKK
jgi:hypothetical protein